MVSGFGVISVYMLITGLPVFIITHNLTTKVIKSVEKVGILLTGCLARLVIDQVGGNDQDHCKRKQPVLVMMPDLFGHQKKKSSCEDQKRKNAVMMFPVSVPEGKRSDREGQKDHKVFKTNVINNVYAE